MLAAARQAEIVRSNQKDDNYLSFLRGSIASIAQSLCGPQSWLHWRKELDLIADLAYFGLTTLAGFQTLGEEYVNIIQVDSSLRKLPSRFSRVLMILMHVAAPYCIDRLLEHIQCRAERADAPVELSHVASVIPAIRHSITIAHRCHLAFFYLRGIFYHLAKRIVGTHYLQVRRGSSMVSQSNYRILGWLSLTQIIFTFVRHVYQLLKTSKERSLDSSFIVSLLTAHPSTSRKISAAAEEPDDESVQDTGRKCSLCLERRKNSTATPCGHLFCWDCIVEWCSTKAECPLCREQFGLSRLILLQNYDTV